ncbi:MAG: ABC transporter ATP-binding protein [Eubacteriales bacterium]|nr:ABC transporter ATP-binding protein [Eubacteriales bacterium]
MNRDLKRAIRRDCRRFLRTAVLASFLHRLSNVAAPLTAAWLIGDMANCLLTLDSKAIASGMSAFLCAVFFQVVVAALFNLALNLLLTRQGFAYDSFLMGKFIRLPLTVSLTADAGSVMERLEEDSAAFCWNQMTLCAYPGAVLLCFAVFGYAMVRNDCPVNFALTIVFLAALPVIRAARIGKRQTALKKQVSENQETRKQLEQELFDARDFAKSYSLEDYFIGRSRNLFRNFLKETGTAQNRMDAKTEVLDFLCSSGVQFGAVLVGAVLISMGMLTPGTLLSGYLMIPAIRQCCQYATDWVAEAHDEKKYLDRLAFFYSAGAEPSDSGEPLDSLDAEDITFTYPGSETPALDGVNFHMGLQETRRLTGSNGSGKTTLLSILAGLYDPQTGIVCNGAAVSQRRNSVALLEQNGTIFSGTVWENLFLPENKRTEAVSMVSSP